jgi:hypothetical protein
MGNRLYGAQVIMAQKKLVKTKTKGMKCIDTSYFICFLLSS